MTDKEFRRLSREELVEIIYELQRSESALREENDQLRTKLADRSLKMEKAGSLAEGILSDAQAQAQKLTQDAEAHIDRKWESFQENTQKLIAMHAELQSLLRRE